ncbi:hypothetical protein Pan14r_32400 [Crateriforma conspicua]|uniref:Uncharacterized protein n=2 Tax=Crateriforma conspicua TaxID=2527996 RepID=A0A5C5YC88_9PLAN|nr:hypothetical protein Mal65_47120 [Crateriforma conspicua]TWT70932.1 hypothetical protein Pan14r_32400 [Crateriforma conspicua]
MTANKSKKPNKRPIKFIKSQHSNRKIPQKEMNILNVAKTWMTPAKFGICVIAGMITVTSLGCGGGDVINDEPLSAEDEAYIKQIDDEIDAAEGG